MIDSFGDGVAAKRAEDVGQSLAVGALEKCNDIGDGAQDKRAVCIGVARR